MVASVGMLSPHKAAAKAGAASAGSAKALLMPAVSRSASANRVSFMRTTTRCFSLMPRTSKAISRFTNSDSDVAMTASAVSQRACRSTSGTVASPRITGMPMRRTVAAKALSFSCSTATIGSLMRCSSSITRKPTLPSPQTTTCPRSGIRPTSSAPASFIRTRYCVSTAMNQAMIAAPTSFSTLRNTFSAPLRLSPLRPEPVVVRLVVW